MQIVSLKLIMASYLKSTDKWLSTHCCEINRVALTDIRLNIPIWVLYEIISKVHLSFNAKWKGTSQKYSLLMNKDFNVGLLLFKCCMYLLSHLLPFNFVIYFKLIFITLSWLRDRQYILNSMDKILIS